MCTDSFSYQDVSRLINILILRYELDCRMHIAKGKPRIYISANSMKKLRDLVKDPLGLSPEICYANFAVTLTTSMSLDKLTESICLSERGGFAASVTGKEARYV